MVTYGLRQAKPLVRIQAPHPILFILLALCFCMGSGSALEVGDSAYYSSAPESLSSAVVSTDSLARVVGGDIFGIYWSSFGGNGQITEIDGVTMKGRADGVQELATATYKTFQGVETAVSSSSSSVVEQLIAIRNNLYDTKGTVYTRLVELLNEFKTVSYNGASAWNYVGGSFNNRNFSDLLAVVTAHLYHSGTWGNYLDSNGFGFSGTRVGWARISGEGFLGLSKLLFGDDSHDIYGLNYNGTDKVGYRGSWSLADIAANGFQGLATLLAGSGDHRQEGYSWLGQGGYAANGPTNLMDMVGDGFLGLSSLLSTAELGEARLSWMYVSPDDGISGLQLKHNTLFSFLGSFASGIQNPIARLAYVLADLEDIEFKKEEKPNMDAVKDHFFGDGEGAVNPDQIKDLAGISSDIKGSFAGAGSAGDAFTAINDSESFWFFSQEVADALDTVNSPAFASVEEDDFMDQFVQDEDGFYSLVDMSPWDVNSYLGG